MSGHSKWSNIKRKKEANDKQKGKTFGKLSRLITLAVIEGGGVTDPENNVKLRLTIDKAKVDNLPKENIQRAIEKGVGPGKTELKEIIYEAFGPGRAAIVILVTTDNPNRTLVEIRNLVERYGGKLATKNALSYLFQKCGVIFFDKKQNKEEEIFVFADKVKALDIDEDESSFSVYFPFEYLGKVKDLLAGLIGAGEIDYKPISFINIESREAGKKIIDLVTNIENLDDVQKVFSNFIIPKDFL